MGGLLIDLERIAVVEQVGVELLGRAPFRLRADGVLSCSARIRAMRVTRTPALSSVIEAPRT